MSSLDGMISCELPSYHCAVGFTKFKPLLANTEVSACRMCFFDISDAVIQTRFGLLFWIKL